jgi:DMSO/TMAO reductase YedYZ molybdopterin-dependent catalytic subunit
MEELSRPEVILATRMNGEPLLPQHGFPLRLIVPGWYGMTSVKSLTSIQLITEPFCGYQHEVSYRFRLSEEDDGRPVSRILPRSLVQPPGIPEQQTRRRIVNSGQVSLSGRAWSGHGHVTSVHVTTDGGTTWARSCTARAHRRVRVASMGIDLERLSG